MLRNIFVIASDIVSAEDVDDRTCEVVLKDGRRYLAMYHAGGIWDTAKHHFNDASDPYAQIGLADRQGFFRQAGNFLRQFRSVPRR